MTRPTVCPYLYAAAVAAAADVPDSDREGVTPEAAVFGRLAPDGHFSDLPTT